jgi:hypothetical protein
MMSVPDAILEINDSLFLLTASASATQIRFWVNSQKSRRSRVINSPLKKLDVRVSGSYSSEAIILSIFLERVLI